MKLISYCSSLRASYKFNHLLMLGCFWVGQSASAGSLCFIRAESFYEQVYCELEAKAQTKGLPSFEEFKNNNEAVQASLLKRPAERNRIKLPVLKTTPIAGSVEKIALPPSVKNSPLKKASGAQINSVRDSLANGCELQNLGRITCASGSYKLIGNRSNSHLVQGVLERENLMALPEPREGQVESEYLAAAYAQYIDKMSAIGLAGVTSTYTKFVYLYRDISARGLNFSQRFETMYSFLKKDKATMAVSEAQPNAAGLSVTQCSPLTERYIVCEHSGRNFVFVRE